MFFILDSSFKRFENCTVKLSAKETKWTSLEVRTHPTFPENLISKYDFGSVKSTGLSRNGPLKMSESHANVVSFDENVLTLSNLYERNELLLMNETTVENMTTIATVYEPMMRHQRT